MAALQIQFYLEPIVASGAQVGPIMFVTPLPADLAFGVLRALNHIEHGDDYNVRVTQVAELPSIQLVDEVWGSVGVQYAQGDLTELAQQLVLTGERNNDDGLRNLGERVLAHIRKWGMA